MPKSKKPSNDKPALSASERLIQQAVECGRVRLDVFEENQDWIAIKGDRESLAFLGNLLLTFAGDEGNDCLVLDSPEIDVFAPPEPGIAPSHGIMLYRLAENRRRAPMKARAKEALAAERQHENWRHQSPN